MATRTAELHIRVAPDLKNSAEAFFAGAGHTLSDGIEQYLYWTVNHQRTPMRLRKRRANIPDLSKMSAAEVSGMLAEAEKEYAAGRVTTVENMKKVMREEYELQV